MENKREAMFWGVFIDFQEQGLGREVFAVTSISEQPPIDLLEEYVNKIKGSENAWDFLANYAGICITNNPKNLPVQVGTLNTPSYIHVRWSP